jgi:uncharacterized protein YfdQ (DUF2303 family)
MLSEQAIELLLKTGRGQQEINQPDGGDPFFVKPNGEVEGVAEFYPPNRIQRNPQFQDAKSFCAYVNRFKAMERSLIFADISADVATFTAIMDYPSLEWVEERGDHCARFITRETDQWKVWKAANRKPMSQIDFATWLEDNLKLIVSPPGAELLELVKNLHSHQTASFTGALRLQTGAYSVNYEESIDVRGTIKGGSLELPKEITGGFALFEGCELYGVNARLKTRIQDRKLVLFFETISLPQLVRESLSAIVAQVEAETKLPVLLGAP